MLPHLKSTLISQKLFFQIHNGQIFTLVFFDILTILAKFNLSGFLFLVGVQLKGQAKKSVLICSIKKQVIERNDRTDVIRKRQYNTQRTVQLWIKADERINRTAHKEQISKKLCLHYIDILRSLIENLSMSKFSNLLFSLT